MSELGIYIHMPFCKRKCYYCDFISFENKQNEIGQYCKAVIKEIQHESKNIKESVSTIYVGGGTPSFVDANYVKQIIEVVKSNYYIQKNAEITVEINPGTVNEEKLKKYKEAGVNRLSIGLQSTKNQLLKQIGRIHTFEEFLFSYNLAKKIGFQNINVDLMLGLPNQTLEDLEDSLKQIIKIAPEHISLYSLIVEKNTQIEKMINNGEIILPEEELERNMYWKTKEILEKNNYKHYEISNYAKEGYESKHNSNCWKQKEYLGFGVAAHSYYQNKRYCNIKSIEEYCKNIEDNNIRNNRITCEIQTNEEKRKEYMLLGLRMIDGINIQEFKNKFIDNPIYVFHKELEKLVKENLIEIDLNQIKLTNKGLDLANLVWEEFV